MIRGRHFTLANIIVVSNRSRVIRDFILLDSPEEQVVLDTTNHETFEKFCLDVLEDGGGGGETVAVICDCSDQRPCVSVCSNTRSDKL